MAGTIGTTATRFLAATCAALMTSLFESPVAAVAQYLEDLQNNTGQLNDRLKPDYVVSEEPASVGGRAYSLRAR